MFKLVFEWAKDWIDEKLKSPFWWSIILTWLTWNWKVWYITLFVSEEKVWNKIDYINTMYNYFDFYNLFPFLWFIFNWIFMPFILTVIIVFFINPKISIKFLEKHRDNKIKENEKENEQIKSEIENLKTKNKKLIEIKNNIKLIKELNQIDKSDEDFKKELEEIDKAMEYSKLSDDEKYWMANPNEL